MGPRRLTPLHPHLRNTLLELELLIAIHTHHVTSQFQAFAKVICMLILSIL